ncbi:hypothetical protein [Azospirillum sp. TSO22-1]|uniref:hypothetical protein n=1 Tax=Azospirillum sp. TSO22-1 TaxID=716789 RepID=UPI000D621374|nr:hypothetical protein [Azospirillum sp. TSO22-1]PWC41752.1 hypothetical protein TSO221_22880 [Azospirillum sp. TSO22-1]
MYRDRISDLAGTLADAERRTEARDLLRPLIERVAVRFSGTDTRTFEMDLEGDIVALLTLGLGAHTKKAALVRPAFGRGRVR